MVAHSPAIPFAQPRERARVVELTAAPLMVWHYGRWRLAREAPAPARRLDRLIESIRFLWHVRAGQPRLAEPLKGFPDYKGTYGSRAEARSYCRRGTLDYVVGFEFNQPPLGDDMARAPTFCIPYHPLFREKDVEDARVYTAVLEERVCVERMNLFHEIGDVAHRTVESARSVPDDL
jgi:hypothetical protein